MDALLNYILDGSAVFDPETLVRLLLVFMCFDCISSMIAAVLHAGGVKR